ncbi:aromatic-ring hydroxylase C-terminal domain-containing protein [Acinetobacter seifertii]
MLIRPDGYIAWTSNEIENAEDELHSAISFILSLS